MKERDADRAEAVRQIASIIAAAYVRLLFPTAPPREVDYPETKSESCDERLTP
jgi:hypothetical protein